MEPSQQDNLHRDKYDCLHLEPTSDTYVSFEMKIFGGQLIAYSKMIVLHSKCNQLNKFHFELQIVDNQYYRRMCRYPQLYH